MGPSRGLSRGCICSFQFVVRPIAPVHAAAWVSRADVTCHDLAIKIPNIHIFLPMVPPKVPKLPIWGACSAGPIGLRTRGGWVFSFSGIRGAPSAKDDLDGDGVRLADVRKSSESIERRAPGADRRTDRGTNRRFGVAGRPVLASRAHPADR